MLEALGMEPLLMVVIVVVVILLLFILSGIRCWRSMRGR